MNNSNDMNDFDNEFQNSDFFYSHFKEFFKGVLVHVNSKVFQNGSQVILRNCATPV